MKFLAIVAVLLVALATASAQDKRTPYDFQKSPQYAQLQGADRTKLDAVHRDLTLLTGALERYADEHGDAAPKALDELVPKYLRELPKDPFATAESAAEKDIGAYTASLKGFGYRYRQGHQRSWIVMSVGLPDFPYLGESGNIGLYQPKGLWISGKQLAPIAD